MELLLIKTPHEIAFTGNPIAFTFAVTPYRAADQQQNISIIIRVEVEEFFNSNIFTEAKESIVNPAGDGTITVPVQSILKSYLKQYMPPLTQQLAINITDQVKRYRLSYRLLKNNILVNGSVNTSEIFYAIRGGMSYQEWHPNKYFTQVIINDKPFLRFAAKKEKVFASEKKYLSWLYPYADAADQKIYKNIGFSDGTELGETEHTSLPSAKWQLSITPAGFEQLGLDQLVPVDKYAEWYSVSVKNSNGDIICNAQKFYLRYTPLYKPSDLLFVNSLGSIETIRLRGKIDAESEYDRIKADKVKAPEYFSHHTVEAANEDMYNAEQEKFTGDTGFLPLDALDRLRDLLLTYGQKKVFEIKNDRLIPINIVSKNDKWYSNKQSLYSHAIEWQHAFTNDHYTPAGTIVSGVCPAVEKLQVRQTASDKLTIAWALETGYDKIEIVIDNGTTREKYVYTGNHGQVEQLFTNPAPPVSPITTGTADVSVEGKTICNDLVDPVDKGPMKLVVVTVSSNVPPTANEDYYTLIKGYSTLQQLPGSALDNDYDSNGDPVEAVPDSGATAQGGSYEIDAAGIVKYKPPTPDFVGFDTFNYTITELGANPLTATSKINITVGSGVVGPTGNVYVKLSNRNPQISIINPLHTYLNSEVWLEFYSDSAGTTPMDVTGLGLIINVRKTTQTNTGTTTNDLTFNAVGSEMKIFTGKVYERSSGTILLAITFTVRPGNGYIAI